MPDFPGMGYPLVPGYESIGTVDKSGPLSGFLPGEKVFVPGAKCFGEFKSLFGGTASKLVVSSARVCKVPKETGEEGSLLALAATAPNPVAPVAAVGAPKPPLDDGFAPNAPADGAEGVAPKPAVPKPDFWVEGLAVPNPPAAAATPNPDELTPIDGVAPNPVVAAAAGVPKPAVG